MDDMGKNMNEYMPLRDVVFHTLRQAILTGELQPGERLMEIHLANRLGVSRTPIREAMRRLELEGLVTMMPRRGAVVADITEMDLRNVLEVRRTLEVMAAELACDRITPEQLKILKEKLQGFQAKKKKGTLVEKTQADVDFHDVIYEATKNPRLVSLISNLREQMYRYRMEYMKDNSAYEQLCQEHLEIYEAIAGKNKEKARECMRRHIDNQEEAVIRAIRESR